MSKPGIKEALIEKYRLMLTMRLEREALEAQGILKFSGEASVRRRMANKELSRRFPGALKELDRLGSESLKNKLETLEPLESGEQDLPLWAKISFDYHQLLSEALAVKSWLALRKQDLAAPEETLEAFRALNDDHYDLAHWPENFGAEYLLQQITNPPGGRLSQLVWEVLQERFSLSIQDMQAMTFGNNDD
jgi:hypothetical protein